MSVHDGTYPVSDPFHPAHVPAPAVPFHTTKIGDTIRACLNGRTEQGTGNVGESAALGAGEHYVIAVNETMVAVQNSPQVGDVYWLRSWVRANDAGNREEQR